uniref:Uncharacterized protein n=1 Tax=Meloidogyne javanica TaxID=6303 RepID=A0A915LS51_MELJA
MPKKSAKQLAAVRREAARRTTNGDAKFTED